MLSWRLIRVLCLFRFPGFRLVRIRWVGSSCFDLPRLLLWLHVRFRFFVRFRIVIRFRLFIMITWRFWYLIGFFIPTFGFPILAGGAPKKEIEQVNWLFLPTLFKRFLYIYSYEDDNSLFKSWPSYALSLPCVSCFCSFLCGQSLSLYRLEISNIDLQLIIGKIDYNRFYWSVAIAIPSYNPNVYKERLQIHS